MRYDNLNTRKPFFVLYFLMLYCAMGYFVLPNQSLLNVAKLFLPLAALIYFVEISLRPIKIKLRDLFLISFLFILVLMDFEYSLFVSTCIISFALIILKPEKYFNQRFLRIVCIVSFIFLIHQLMANRFIQPNDAVDRIVLSVRDPNFSGAIMLLFFLFSFKVKFIPGICLCLISIFLFFSRSYALSIVLFFLILIFEKRLRDNYSPTFIFVTMMLGLIIFLAFTFVMGLYYDFNYSTSKMGMERLLLVADYSTSNRIRINSFVLYDLFRNPDLLLLGVRNEYNNYIVSHIGNVIHNSFLTILFKDGLLYFILYFYVVSILFSRLLNKKNVKYVLSFLIFSMLLHCLMEGLSIMFLLIILSLPEQKASGFGHLQHSRKLVFRRGI